MHYKAVKVDEEVNYLTSCKQVYQRLDSYSTAVLHFQQQCTERNVSTVAKLSA